MSEPAPVPSQAELLQEVERRVRALDEICEFYYMSDKESRIQQELQAIMTLIDMVAAVPFGAGDSSSSCVVDRARLLYLRGRAHDAHQQNYSEEAEKFLTKAVKLDPCLCDAWTSLGHTYAKKRDMLKARDCLERAIKLDSSDAKPLRYLAVVMRTIGEGNSPERHENMHKSFALTKQALALNLDDPFSWFFSGNSYLMEATMTKVQSEAALRTSMERALKAFTRAEMLFGKLGHEYPDIWLNRAEAYRYLLDYNGAIEAWKRCHVIDPYAGADALYQQHARLLTKIGTQIKNKCRLKARQVGDSLRVIKQSVVPRLPLKFRPTAVTRAGATTSTQSRTPTATATATATSGRGRGKPPRPGNTKTPAITTTTSDVNKVASRPLGTTTMDGEGASRVSPDASPSSGSTASSHHDGQDVGMGESTDGSPANGVGGGDSTDRDGEGEGGNNKGQVTQMGYKTLREGDNPSTVVVARYLIPIEIEAKMILNPMLALCMDSDAGVFLLAVYNSDNVWLTALREQLQGQQGVSQQRQSWLAILDPCFRMLTVRDDTPGPAQLHASGTEWRIPCIKVFNPDDLVCNGIPGRGIKERYVDAIEGPSLRASPVASASHAPEGPPRPSHGSDSNASPAPPHPNDRHSESDKEDEELIADLEELDLDSDSERPARLRPRPPSVDSLALSPSNTSSRSRGLSPASTPCGDHHLHQQQAGNGVAATHVNGSSASDSSNGAEGERP
ncbi:unnamed protein product [Vitrella brassicaformis CCMP3155]|uniref:Tetratricopeptide repeat protein 5 OB fold domain-containing protein n=2 Tax=Vitrella brassicaformis TaxID=1169539 RepID=A0A0G4G8I7_VITBC|nr:unnamed protein product [Vitrella brassicaformis CCMP3155]|eukprot:CEM25146.1 unnamed protein product [Vitrella brassicaformis CCMP3155]